MFLAEDDADGAAAAEPVTVVLKPSATPRPEHAAPGAGEDEQGEADEDDADEGEDAERVAAVAVAAAAELATSARSGPSWPARLIGYAMVGVSLLVVLLVQGLAYWLMGKVTGVPAGILPCLLAALAATLVRGGLQLCGLGLFLGAPAAALVACGVLYKWSDAQTFIDVFFIVAVGNAIMEAMFMFGMAWVAGMAMGAAASLSSL
jgi:hypothetical protein